MVDFGTTQGRSMSLNPFAGSFGNVSGIPLKAWEIDSGLSSDRQGTTTTGALSVLGEHKMIAGDEVTADLLFIADGRFGFFGCDATVQEKHPDDAADVIRVAFKKQPVVTL